MDPREALCAHRRSRKPQTRTRIVDLSLVNNESFHDVGETAEFLQAVKRILLMGLVGLELDWDVAILLVPKRRKFVQL